MRQTDRPPPVTVPFAQNGSRNDIPVSSQISVTKGAASFNDGFPPLTMTSPLKGGIPPFGQDMNGVLFVLSRIARWVMSSGALAYDTAFATDPNIGGYPAGALLLRVDAQGTIQGFWLNGVDNNATNPDATDGSAAGWMSLNADWNATSGPGVIRNRPTLAKVATSGKYSDLAGTPPSPVNTDWSAESGLAEIRNRPDLAAVATSGKYEDLVDPPAIPAEQVNADWDADSGFAEILNRPNLAKVATSGNYADLTGEPQFETPPQFDHSTAPATTEFVQRALGSFSGQVTLNDDTKLKASHAGMAIQWAGADGGKITLARTSTLPLNAVAFLIYHHGAGVLNLLAQGNDFIWMGGPDAAPGVVLAHGEFALCLARVNGEYDVLVTRLPVNADWDAGAGAAHILNRPDLAQVATSGQYADLSGTPTIPAAQVNSDWNATQGVAMILNKPSSLSGLASGLQIELGYAGTRGIDKGDHYELDFSTGTSPFGGFPFTLNGDNSISVPSGMYLVDADIEILAPVEDDWQIPAQVIFSVCNGYGYPGVYQQAVRRFPDPPLSTQKKGGTLGSLVRSPFQRGTTCSSQSNRSIRNANASSPENNPNYADYDLLLTVGNKNLGHNQPV
ncbi:hypothetical protein AWB75_06015 [Caballeronia catudaia]|uniref:Uncharacterized protein n=1 Tax=Caballeronia catudaia TaxID=1777136 RepID=A0A158D1D3_9BURK|nr:hypothetical protein [Caballeronia catudaia]SAK88036.1 hypothetical protein AWB75_06015 [Caballeronia catudaia]